LNAGKNDEEALAFLIKEYDLLATLFYENVYFLVSGTGHKT
jgi:hypothetical protein